MSGNNFTFENISSLFNFEDPWCLNLMNRIFKSGMYLDFIYDALGIPLNAWILVAILTSTDLRARMRNKILACICAQGLFDCLILLPLSMYYYFDFLHYFSSCHANRAHDVIFYFSEFVSNWNIVTLLALVLYTLYGSSVTLGGWNRLLTQVLTCCLLLWPWLFSAITVISIILSNYVEHIDTWNGVTSCRTSLGRAARALYALDIGVPSCVAAVLMAGIIFLNRKRARNESNRGDIARQLIGDSSDSEPIIPYIAIVSTIFVCDFIKLLRFIYIDWKLFSSAFCISMLLEAIIQSVEGARDVLLPLVFLLFPEVRFQAKKLVLRALPGRRSADVTVAYVKDV